MNAFRLLVIADVHYAPGGPDVGARRRSMGLELLRRAIEDARLRGGFDAIALLGDLLDDASRPDAIEAIEALRGMIRQSAGECPLLVVPGNHDGDAAGMLRLLGCQAGLHRLGGYRFITFADAYGAGDACSRSLQDRREFQQWAAGSEGPVVVLQHNPMSPVIECDYPYMLSNREAVMDDYSRFGVLLSISGHYHRGQAINEAGKVRYFTAPALCEAPFQYAVVALRGRDVQVETRSLAFGPVPPVVDYHTHTEFAYCGRDITAGQVIERARMFGLAGVCLTEHAPQLYCRAEDFWSAGHILQPALWRSDEFSRMGEFRRRIVPLRGPGVKIGLEVELDGDGLLTIRDEDRDVCDVLVGAVHWVRPGVKDLSNAQVTSGFMKIVEGLLARGIDILAHPLRYFAATRRPEPVELYSPLAEALASAGVAAEINYHILSPQPAFFAECLARGVKIALGSDAHLTHEMSALGPHMALLQELAGRPDVSDLLYMPPARP